MARPNINNVDDLAQMMHDILRSNRDVVAGTAGMTGEGKSVFAIQLIKAYCRIIGLKFDFDFLTWERKEMMRWIDGVGDSKEGQKEEYSPILPDELIGMFYGRSWYEEGQKDSIKVFNTCRDRHLLIVGNVPNFWELDGGFRSRVRFYIFIPERGVAWIFQQENNPFTKDVWNVVENCKLFRKRGLPYSSKNFICEVHYDDLTLEEAQEYQNIRDKKRIHINDKSKERQEKYSRIMRQRNVYLKALSVAKPKLSQKDIAEMGDISEGLVSMIINGL